MNKAELIKAIASKAELNQKAAAAVLDALTVTITEALKAGENVALLGFGTFEVRERAERQGRNPATGEAITIAASKTPVFKPGKALKDAIQ